MERLIRLLMLAFGVAFILTPLADAENYSDKALSFLFHVDEGAIWEAGEIPFP